MSQHQGRGAHELDELEPNERTILAEPGSAPAKDSTVVLPAATALKNAAQPIDPTLVPSKPKTNPGAGDSQAGGTWESGQQGPPPPGTAPRPGTRIGHYEVIRELGKGGMGAVFLARDTRLGRKVAIKFLHTNNAELTQRFVLEARATARCSHENIVIIYEVGEFGGSPFMVLEYLTGEPLQKHLRKGQKLPVPRAIELIVPVVRALACAHGEGIVHRDLKPENIVITEAGTIKVLDFGIAKVLEKEEASREAAHDAPSKPPVIPSRRHASSGTGSGESTTDLTRHGAIMGTLAYMAPEQWGIGIPIDHRADLWAVGILLFRLLAGKHPLDPLQGEQLFVTGVLSEPMPKLRDVAPEIPQGLADVVDRCLKKRKDERFADAAALLRALEPFLPGRYQEHSLAANESPYAGLSSFQENDAHRFFGRSREIAAIVHRIADRPLLGVVGTSGAGKSSFVRAGLVPALKRSGEAWETVVVRPGRNPLAALASLVAPMLNTSSSVADELNEQHALIERIRAEPGYVGAVLRSRSRREKKKLLLFVDQFEELYTLVPDLEERLAFTACLSGIADDATAPTRVVLSIRSDFLDRASEDDAFMSELSQGLFFLNAPGKDGLRAALVQPAEMAGYKFETKEMVESMLGHLESTPGALPLLQFAATQLWEMRDAAKKLLTVASYEAIGGIAGALATHADKVIGGLTPNSAALARAIFLRLVTPERTRAIVAIDELRELAKDKGEVQRLIDHLVQARLLVVQTGGGASGGNVEIVHESLIQTWPTLRRWLDEGQEDSAFVEQLRNAAKQWAAKGKDADLLWRGEVVEEARRFQRRFRGQLTSHQKDFLEAVFANHAKAERRKRMLTLSAISFLVLLVAASAVALVIIFRAQREAEKQAIAAKSAEGIARLAENEAKQRLEEVQQKERERQAAARRAELASLEVQKKNEQLIAALEAAELGRTRARWLHLKSEKSAKAERAAREEALRAAQELQTLLRREQERARRLEGQLGSPVIEELK